MEPEEIKDQVVALVDTLTEGASNRTYREALEEIISELDSRLQALED